MLPTLSLIFGGCCSNVVTLEQLTTDHPDAGSLLTFLQFLVVALYGLPKHITFTHSWHFRLANSHWRIPVPRLKPRKIHIASYAAQVFLFYIVSLLNNAAFAYRIPMAVHIIFRSGGLVVSMLLGWTIAGKRYTIIQILSVLLVTAGVIITTLSVPRTSQSSRKASQDHPPSTPYAYAAGICFLTTALILSGFLGLIQDWTYSHYGRPRLVSSNNPPANTRQNDSTRHGTAVSDNDDRKTAPSATGSPTWQESMFYLHFLGLPMFLSIRHDLVSQFNAINAADATLRPAIRISFPFSVSPDLSRWLSLTLPRTHTLLLVNTITHLVCVAGVHRLTTRVSALTVTLVLVVRKAASFVISVLWLRTSSSNSAPEPDHRMMWFGAFLVLVGTIAYSVSGPKRSATQVENLVQKRGKVE